MNQDNRPECRGEREENLRPCPFCGAPPHDVVMTEGCDYYISCQCCGAMVMEEGSDSVIKAWNQRHTEQPEGWVSVEEKIPEFNTEVLGINNNGSCLDEREPIIIYFDADGFEYWCHPFWYNKGKRLKKGHITHWQPLPKPPEASCN